MDDNEARSWLDGQWARARHDGPDDPAVDKLVNSGVVSIRYALITQLLGKIADPSRDILAIQAAGGERGWDARSFAKNVVVPWVAANRNILGTSPDPYVNNPLRRERLDSRAPLMNRELWDDLVGYLGPLDTADRQVLEENLRRCLGSVARRGRRQDTTLILPPRVSLERLCEMTGDFIGKPSGGLRPLAIGVALMKVLGEAFTLFDRVDSQGINEADSQSDAAGDITCYKDDAAVLVVEVKDRGITFDDCSDTATKARGSGITNILFTAPGVVEESEITIRALKSKLWREGCNLYHVDMVSFMEHVFVLLDEKWRIELLKRTAEELDLRGRFEDRVEWNEQCMAS